jgi:cell division protein FtsN
MSMVDDTDRPVRSDGTGSGMAHTPSNDPLAELARLIGQDDPFRDSRSDSMRTAPRREADKQPYVEAPRSAPGWLARNEPANDHVDPAPAPTHYDNTGYEHDAAHDPHAADPRYEDDPRYAYTHAHGDHHDANDPYRAEDDTAYDPAYADAPDHYYSEQSQPEAYDEAPVRRRGLATIALAVVAVLGAGGVYAYRSYSAPSASSGQVPVIKAPDTPNKVAPAPVTADNTPSKQIYDRVNDKGQGEKLGTTQEEPLDVKGNPKGGIPGLIAAAPPGGATQPAPTAPTAAAPAGEPKKVKTIPIRPDQATAPGPAPMRVGANQAPTPPARNSAIAGGFVVQVASQRSEADAQASYQALQTKYPAVLGNRESTIKKFDAGSKGVYYRVNIGPFASQEQAKEMCASLQAAGGQCVVQKN